MRPEFALSSFVPVTQTPRACRHSVKWPARVKSIAGASWQPGHVLNLSVTGVLVQVDELYEIGERVEVEIDFFVERTTPASSPESDAWFGNKDSARRRYPVRRGVRPKVTLP